ncbi:MAG: hypothetical protein HY898_16995 [Deltaproteobacteria bacterium]|nr:hypothetical protein [Deltaproteobacteria bacterium]
MGSNASPDKVTVARGLRVHEAEALRQELAMHGIESWILDSSHTETMSAPGLAPMGRLLVASDREAEATAILSEFDKRKPPDDTPEDKAWRADVELDKTASRAFRASVAGLLCLPYGLHMYSIALLMTLRPDYGRLSRATRTKVWGAALLNAAVCIIVATMLWLSGYELAAGVLGFLPILIVGVGSLRGKAPRDVQPPDSVP